MKWKRFSRIFMSFAIVSLLSAGNQLAWGEKIKVKGAAAMPDSHPTSIGLKYMGELASEISGGLLDVQTFTSGSVGGEGEILESVSQGTLQVYMGATAGLVSYVPEFGIFDLPYLFKSRGHVDRVLWGPIGEELAAIALKKGFRILGWADSGFVNFENSRRPITSLADMKGLKMRVIKSPTKLKAMNLFGASAVPISFTELYGAMETGVVDGCEMAYQTYQAASHYEVAKYYTVSDHSFMVTLALVSEKFYQSLSPRMRAVIRHLGGMGALRYRHTSEERDVKAKEIVKKVSVVNVLSDSARKEFRKAAQPVWDDYKKKFGSNFLDKIAAAE